MKDKELLQSVRSIIFLILAGGSIEKKSNIKIMNSRGKVEYL